MRVNEMSKILTYKEISYELKETQGFYFCLVYAEGKKSHPYQTKYFASAEGARSEAIAFIEYYDTFGKNKQKASRAQRQKQNQEKVKTIRSKLKELRRIIPILKPKDEKSRAQGPKLKQEDTTTEHSDLTGEMSRTPTPKPKKEINRDQRLKSQDSQQGRRVGIFPVLLLVGISLLIMTLIAYGYSEYLESEDRQNQVIPTTPGIDSPGSGVSLPAPRETIVLPQLSQSQTPTLAVTPTTTTTTTITPRSTNFSTQPPITATNTQRPTDPPSLTSTPTPSTSPTPTNTATPTSPPAPTDTLTPTPTMSPTLTPLPSTITPTATITPSETPTTP